MRLLVISLILVALLEEERITSNPNLSIIFVFMIK